MRTATSGVGFLIAAAAALLPSAPAAGAGDDTEAAQTRVESAVWTPKELKFVYMGLSSQYSCDGLRDRVMDVLLKLGARRDLEVRESACVSVGEPDPFPGVSIRMNVLQPAAGEGKAAQGAAVGSATVPAHWKRVDLTSTRNAGVAGDCDLLDQIREEIIPLFATRNVEYGSNCQPHQLQLGAAWLRAEVLVPDADPAAALSTGRPGPAPDR